MVLNEKVRWLRVGSAIGFAGVLGCLAIVFQQARLAPATPPVPVATRPAPVESKSPLADQLAEAQTQLGQLREERDAAFAQASQLREQYQEELEINNRLRDDLTKATAKLRQQSGKAAN